MTKESREAYAIAQEEQTKSREAMAELNAKTMAAQESARPEPSIEEIQKATTPRGPRVTVAPVEDEADETPKVVTKESTPDKAQGGNYKTRDMSAKK
jgi:hypothetical protein